MTEKLHKMVDGVEVPLTEDEIAEYNQRTRDHEIAQTAYQLVAYKDRRKKKYNKRGADIQSMVVALWENIVENKSEESDRIQAIRVEIKTEEPKPE